MDRLPVDDPDDPRIAEFVGLRERALRRGLRPSDPRQRLPAPETAPGPASGGDRHDAPDARVDPTPGATPADGPRVEAGSGEGAGTSIDGRPGAAPADGPRVEAGSGEGAGTSIDGALGGEATGPAGHGPRAGRAGSGVPPAASGVFVAEGDIVVVRALRAGYRLRAALVDATRREPLPAEVPAQAPVYAAAPAVLQRITGLPVHPGMLASFDRRPPPPAAELLAAPSLRRIAVLERVSNPTNLGVILRSARGLGIDAALLDPTCTDPLYRRVSRVAMGEGYALPWAVLPALPGGLDLVRAAGFRVVALTPDPEAVALDGLGAGPEDRLALLLGAEGPGLSAETLAAADVRARIPMHADVDSLNVGVAAGIAFWVIGRPRREASPGPPR